MAGTKILEGKPNARYFYLEPLLVVTSDSLSVGDYHILLQVEKIQEIYLSDSSRLEKIRQAVGVAVWHRHSEQGALNFIKEINNVSAVGVKNHGLFNYKEGLEIDWLFNAMYRHAIKFALGEYEDEESGESHIAHIIANMLMLVQQLEK